MELNFEVLQDKASAQKEETKRNFRNYLAEVRDQASNENRAVLGLLNKAGKKLEDETRQTIEGEVNIAIKRAEEEIKDEYARSHGISETDSSHIALKNILKKIL